MCAQCDPRRVETFERGVAQAERLGQAQKVLRESPFFPAALVAAFIGLVMFALWGVEVSVDALL